MGKTTFARKLLPKYAECLNFVNVDLIAQGLSPFAPESAAIRAGRIMLELIEDFARRRMDFGFETTLSGRSYLNLLHDLRQQQCKITIFYLWAPTVEVTGSRVKQRVVKGGHNVPEVDQIRRFGRSLKNFLVYYRHCVDAWTLFDNSGVKPIAIAEQKQGEIRIMKSDIYKLLMEQYGHPE